MIAHVGIQHLVDDHAAHHEAHGSTEAEDEADRGAGAPVVLLEVDEALLGQHGDIVGQQTFQPLNRSRGIGPRLQTDQPHLNAAGGCVGQQLEKGLAAGEQVAIGAEGGAQTHQPGHPNTLAGNLTLHGAAGLEPLGHGAELGS